MGSVQCTHFMASTREPINVFTRLLFVIQQEDSSSYVLQHPQSTKTQIGTMCRTSAEHVAMATIGQARAHRPLHTANVLFNFLDFFCNKSSTNSLNK